MSTCRSAAALDSGVHGASWLDPQQTAARRYAAGTERELLGGCRLCPHLEPRKTTGCCWTLEALDNVLIVSAEANILFSNASASAKLLEGCWAHGWADIIAAHLPFPSETPSIITKIFSSAWESFSVAPESFSCVCAYSIPVVCVRAFHMCVWAYSIPVVCVWEHFMCVWELFSSVWERIAFQ